MSACHVLALQPDGSFKKNIPIYHPGRQDKEPLTGEDEIGLLISHYTTFSRIGSNYVDAAYAMLSKEAQNRSCLLNPPNQIPASVEEQLASQSKVTKSLKYPIAGPLSPNYIMDEELDDLEGGQTMAKVGRTTGFTIGGVSGVKIDDVTVHVHGVGNIRFDNLLEIQWEANDKPFALDGDLGSLVFDLASRRPVGLHFAGGILERDGQKVGVSYACNLEYILKMWNLHLL